MAAHSDEDQWTAAMRRGDLEAAWSIKDAELQRRLRGGAVYWRCLPRHLQSVWNGQPLAKKRVLVRCYHGFGDTIQFIRFLQPLREIAHSVSLLLELSRTALRTSTTMPM